MTESTEPRSAGSTPAEPLGPDWRAAAARSQQQALASGTVALTCSAPLGAGGLGRHLSEIADALQRDGRPAKCINGTTRSEAGAGSRDPRHALGIPYLTRVLSALPPVPVPPGVRTRAFLAEFDAYAAAGLPDAEDLIAFNGQAVAQLRAARAAGYSSLTLVSANSHMRQVERQHELAHRSYPLEGSWAKQLLERNLTEYAAADRILVSSRYVRESFLEQGVPEQRLVDFPLTPDPRYQPGPVSGDSGRFDIVYVGSLHVHKGVPLLVDAFRRLPYPDMRLLLVGGWATRGMRRFIQEACARDSRISVCPGDPLPRFREASLCVHPAYEDGFAYAPAEALACGVPVIVSEDTGMKDLVDPGRSGLILPTGDLGALTQSIEAAYRGEMFAGTPR